MYELDFNEYARLARQAAAEGCVLLKNDRNALPLRESDAVAVFGRIQFDYYYCGTGSGGMINVPYVSSILGGLKESRKVCAELEGEYLDWIKSNPFDKGTGWAGEPWSQREMPVTDALVDAAAKSSDVAVVIIGRTAGEDRDNVPDKGGYYLSDEEEALIKRVTAKFSRTAVVLNIGSLMDLSFIDRYDPAAALIVWAGGCEGGRGAADVLTGAVCPSGRLCDTAAMALSDYPCHNNFGSSTKNIYTEDIYVGYRYFETFKRDRVRYPFAYGLSYTSFKTQTVSAVQNGAGVALELRVFNTGSVPGKQAVTVFAEAPHGVLGKPARQLVAFTKTGLIAPGESELLRLEVDMRRAASYDDGGLTGHRSCFVLEAGEYALYVGGDAREAEKAFTFLLPNIIVSETLGEAMAPITPFRRLKTEKAGDGFIEAWEDVPLASAKASCCAEVAPQCTGDRGIKLEDVRAGRALLEDFTAQLDDCDLAALSCGEGMCPPNATPGIASAFGGTTQSLRGFGIPVCGCADGPSGIRMDCGTSAFCVPCGTSFACTFNTKLVGELYGMVALELMSNGIDTLLGPGVNIHRSPLCGRNFEYFSEDPLLAGLMAAAQISAMQRFGVTGTMKHFACNNQEFCRTDADSVLSERALREIYLRPFEYAVKVGKARSIMTSYNPINGIWAAGNLDMLTNILRGEWGFDGIVMTDWWAKMNDAGQPARSDNAAAMLRAQNDLYMVVPKSDDNANYRDALTALKAGRLGRWELLRSAKNILRFIMLSPKMGPEAEKSGVRVLNAPAGAQRSIVRIEGGILDAPLELDAATVKAQRGSSVMFTFACPEPGEYELLLSVRSDAAGVAQTPLSVYMTGMPIASITVKGSESVERTVPFTIKSSVTNYLEFAFASSGLTFTRLCLRRAGVRD